jgi:predicted ArsR family transcriptional regulator
MEHSGSETRELILEALGDGAPRHPRNLAVELGMHVNTVRRHLELLESAGKVRRTPEIGGLPGRPRILYARTDEHLERACTGYRFLARAMAAFVAGTHGDPSEAGRSAGEAWGRHLVDAEPFSRLDPETALSRAYAILDELGYAPSRHLVDADLGLATTTLGQCPFPELAETFPELICSFHLGLIRGASESLSATLAVGELTRIPPDGPCLLSYDIPARAARPRSRPTPPPRSSVVEERSDPSGCQATART